MNTARVLYAVFLAGCVFFALRCTDPPLAGNSSQTPNAVVGILYQPDGTTPAAGVRVHIRPRKSLPDTSGSGLVKRLASLTTVDSVITDSAGRFAFDSTLDTGTYVIEAANGNNAVLIDSVTVISDSTDTLPPDTLKPAGAIKGVIRLSEGGDPRKVFVLAFGIDRFARVEADGQFKFAGLAEAAYDLRLISSLDNYGVLDTNAISVISADTTDLDTIELPFTGIPTPRGLSLIYDTLNQIVLLSWEKMDTALIDGINIYRAVNGQNFILQTQVPLPETTTVYKDSAIEVGSIYEYRIVSRKSSGEESRMVDLANDTIRPVSAALVTTTLRCTAQGDVADTARIDDTVGFCLNFLNPTRKITRVSWYLDTADSLIRTVAESSLSGSDTLTYVWNTTGPHTLYVKVTDDAGTVWNASYKITIVLGLPVVNAGEDTIVSRNDTVHLRGTATSKFGYITKWEWDIGNTGDFRQCLNGDTIIIMPASFFTTVQCILRVTDNYGQSSLDTQLITTHPVWVQATASANFAARWRHAAVVFDNKIWIIGGKDVTSDRNDVWYSADGANWVLATANASFSPREDHAAVVFQDKIWVIAGWAPSQDKNDVWYSSDGINWTIATPSAGFSTRRYHSAIVFNDKIWVIGGYHGGTDNRLNDVWNSEDGIMWNKVSDSAAFCPRENFCCKVFNGKMWVISGLGGYDNDFKCPKFDSWYSVDGVSWTLSYSDTGNSQRFFCPSIVFDNKIWLIGGQIGHPFDDCKDVWWSEDGKKWNVVPENTPGFLPRGGNSNTTVVFNDRIFIIGGYVGSYKPTNEVWYSR